MLNRSDYAIIAPLFNRTKANILTSTQLPWQALQPDSQRYQSVFSQLANNECDDVLAEVQPRLLSALDMLQQQQGSFPLLLIRSQENQEYMAQISAAAERYTPPAETLFGGDYLIKENHITLLPATDASAPFTAQGGVHYAEWFEPEQLFGCLRQYRDTLTLEPGLLHQANGGTLILSVRTLLSQPLMWMRLKTAILQQQLAWTSQDERQPLPVHIPPMPLDLRLILCGERDALAEFQEMEPEYHELAIYSEFEENLQILDEEEMTAWCHWIRTLAAEAGLPEPQTDFWPLLINEGVRYTGEQDTLPLCPRWLLRQLREAASGSEVIDRASYQDALDARSWREGYLAERMRDEILQDQIRIETDGEVVGQINGLSVIEFPGHPRAWGDPSRITCVVHPGDGEFMDIERKAELGGNIHAKGMMIMQAYLTAELELDQQLPFSASVVFEQSYSEVDGDSASLAELCVMISALAEQPINQQIAVTGSVDQFGNVQPVGGLNEKIEGFFDVCQQRELTGKQGVIIPASNQRHLSLHSEVVAAVERGEFHIWAIDQIDEALPLLCGMAWRSENEQDDCLLHKIQERIALFNQPEPRERPWLLRWLNWF